MSSRDRAIKKERAQARRAREQADADRGQIVAGWAHGGARWPGETRAPPRYRDPVSKRITLGPYGAHAAVIVCPTTTYDPAAVRDEDDDDERGLRRAR